MSKSAKLTSSLVRSPLSQRSLSLTQKQKKCLHSYTTASTTAASSSAQQQQQQPSHQRSFHQRASAIPYFTSSLLIEPPSRPSDSLTSSPIGQYTYSPSYQNTSASIHTSSIQHAYAQQTLAASSAIQYLDSSPPFRGTSSNSAMHDFFGKTFPVPRRSFILQHGASGIPKDSRKTPPIGDMLFKSVQVGEDAYFRRSDSLGVADGVGGWKGREGANAAMFSKKLMHYACVELEKYDNVIGEEMLDYYDCWPADILEKSYRQVMKDATSEGVVGSSTALLAVLRDDELRIANIGDCMVSIIRGKDFLFRSEEQQHSFNFPFQLGSNSRDSPQDAQIFTVKIQQGDIVILCSDGMADNLFDEIILEEVVKRYTTRRGGALQIEPQALSDALAQKAKSISEDQHNVSSPFQQKAANEGYYYSGGKPDDISVLVATIQEDLGDSPDRRAVNF